MADFNLFRPSTWGFKTVLEDTGEPWYDKIWYNIKRVFTLPSEKGRETITEGAKEVVSGVAKIFSPILVWVVLIGILILIFWKKIEKIV